MPDARTAKPHTRDVLLLDGRIAQIREVVQADRDELLRMHTDASDLSLYRRFFSLNHEAAERFISRVCDPANGFLGLVATCDTKPCGLATAVRTSNSVAEVALFVAEDAHGCGIGTLLLENLLAAPALRSVVRFEADVLITNAPMLDVFRDAGFTISTKSDRSTVHLEIDPRVNQRVVTAATRRESIAEHASLVPLLEPRSIVVVGVSHERGKVGREVLESLLKGGFSGPLFALARSDLRIEGVETVGNLSQIESAIDLVVVAVPEPDVVDIVQQAAKLRAGACVVLASGFGESGPRGRTSQRAIVDVARRNDMRVVGPNCLGIISHLGSSAVHADFAGRSCPPGRIALATQSGGVAIALLDALDEAHLGVAAMVSLGNQADVSARDLIAAWADDDRIDVGALYLESTAEARHFVHLARAFSMRKPLVAIFGGDSEAGRRAGASHTAAQLTSAARLEALIEASGIIPARDVDEMADISRLLHGQPLPHGRRVGIVGNAGGLGVIAADAAQGCGMEVPDLARGNPCDVGAGADAEAFAQAVCDTADDVDALLLIVVSTGANDARAMTEAAADRVADVEVPCLVVLVGEDISPRRMTRYCSTHRAVNALAAVARYADWRRSDDETEPSGLDVERATCVRRLLESSPTSAATGGWLRPDDTLRALAPYHFPTPDWSVIYTDDAAVEVADATGYPVVAKALIPGVVHKSDQGLVATGLHSADEVRAAVQRMQQVSAGSPIVIQEQADPGIELAIGVINDADVGPMVMIAAGGLAIDVWDDQVFLMPPLTPHRVATALNRLRIWRLLEGHRDQPRADVDAVIDLVCRVGSMALELPEVTELDMNPVVVHPAGVICVDVKVRIAESTDFIQDAAPALTPRAHPLDEMPVAGDDEGESGWISCTKL